jgi:4-hydroxy-4-methyl-2-oxoglutarate aldolase
MPSMEPLTPDELAALRAISTPTVCNAIETFDVRRRNEGFMDSTIICRFPDLGPVVGYAVTAKIRAAQATRTEVPHSKVWAEFERIPKPWLVVIEDLDYPDPLGSFWGEVNASVYKALGAIGTVTNGGVRDLPEVRATGFQFFSSCVLVSHAYVHIVEYGGPVVVGGLTVTPGDLLHGDEHGVTSIPLEIARDLPQAAQTIESAERRLIDYARSPDRSPDRLAEIYGGVD